MHRRGATLQNLFQCALFGLRKFIQDKLLRVAELMLRLNPDPYPNELIGCLCGNALPVPVVSSGAATRAQANRSERQRQVVTDYDERPANFIQISFGDQTSDGFAAQIHKGLRLYQLYPLAFDNRRAQQRPTVTTSYRHRGVSGQPVNEHEADVVP
jgi:hypothetical protein